MASLRLLSFLDRVLQDQRGALMPWCPVFMGLGVAVFFGLRVEPGAPAFAAAALAGAGGLAAAWVWRASIGPLGLALAFCVLGFLSAGLRTHLVAGPVLDFRFYGAIEGEILAVDRSASDALRLTLGDLTLERMAPEATPRRVRVSLFGDQGFVAPEPGARIMLTGHLGPPNGPAEPGGFDFQRHSWFLGLGGVGYTRTPVLLIEPRPEGARALTHLRLRLSDAIQTRIAGQPGAFAAAVTTGDRSGLSLDTLQDMRGSNIAHLLAISGLHMGLLAGFVFAAIRIGLAAIPVLALHYPIRKWAAAVAFLAGGFYLLLSGGNVATERAFIQVAVMLGAVMLDRRAITLRSVAIAAIIVLLRRPETLLSPGFQMSFAATAALVAVFDRLRAVPWLRERGAVFRWGFALSTSSIVAGAATAPFAASQFNIMAAYGLAANLVAVPIMGSLIVPAAVVAGLLAPFGLEAPALWVMEQGLIVILRVADAVTGWPGSVRPIVSPPAGVMAAVICGGLWLILWRGRARLAGLLPILAALAIWPMAERPVILISDTGGLVGVLGDGMLGDGVPGNGALAGRGRALSRERGEGFVAGIWLENDGEFADQAQAAARPGWAETGAGGQSAQAGAWRLWHATGQRAANAASEVCATHDVIILNAEPEGTGPAPDPELPPVLPQAGGGSGCIMLTPSLLRRTGALAIDGQGRIQTTRAHQGARLWSDPDLREARDYQ